MTKVTLLETSLLPIPQTRHQRAVYFNFIIWGPWRKVFTKSRTDIKSLETVKGIWQMASQSPLLALSLQTYFTPHTSPLAVHCFQALAQEKWLLINLLGIMDPITGSESLQPLSWICHSSLAREQHVREMLSSVHLRPPSVRLHPLVYLYAP